MRMARFPTGEQWHTLTFVRVVPDREPHVSSSEAWERKLHIPVGYLLATAAQATYALAHNLRNRSKHDIPLATAREGLKHIGIEMPHAAFNKIHSWRVFNHTCYLFACDMTLAQSRQAPARVWKYFPVRDFYKLLGEGRLNPEHRRWLVESAAILPLGRYVHSCP